MIPNYHLVILSWFTESIFPILRICIKSSRFVLTFQTYFSGQSFLTAYFAGARWCCAFRRASRVNLIRSGFCTDRSQWSSDILRAFFVFSASEFRSSKRERLCAQSNDAFFWRPIKCNNCTRLCIRDFNVYWVSARIRMLVLYDNPLQCRKCLHSISQPIIAYVFSWSYPL